MSKLFTTDHRAHHDSRRTSAILPCLTYHSLFSPIRLSAFRQMSASGRNFSIRDRAGIKEYLNSATRRRRRRRTFTVEVLRELEIPLPPLEEQRRIVAELDAEAAQMEAVRALLPRFEAKIQRVLDRVWGNGIE